MNLIMVGSCADSSELAKSLNKNLKDSLVYRHDLLAGFKSLLNFTGNIDKDPEADYLGDYETINFSKLGKNEKIVIEDLFNKTLEVSSKTKKTISPLVLNSFNKFSKRTLTFKSVNFSFVNILSGVVNKTLLTNVLSIIDNPIVIKIKPKTETLLPITVSNKDIEAEIELKGNGIFYGEFNSVEEFLNSEACLSLFVFEDKKKKPVLKEQLKTKYTWTELLDRLQIPIAQAA